MLKKKNKNEDVSITPLSFNKLRDDVEKFMNSTEDNKEKAV